MTTPPQTPLSATGGSVLGKRDEHTAATKTEEASDVATGGDKKRRRIAPTLITVDTGSKAEKTPNKE